MKIAWIHSILLFCSLAQASGQNSLVPISDTIPSTVADTTVVAWVNGLPLEAKWLREEMHYDKGKVMRKYTDIYGREAVYTKGFWENTFHPDSAKPIEELKAITLQRLCSLKAEQYLLKEHKLIRETRYTELMERREMVNKERKKTKANGGIIYGPVEYGSKMYYSYYYSNKLIELKKKLAKKAKLPKEEELEQQYQRDKEEFNLPEIKVEVITLLEENNRIKETIDKETRNKEDWSHWIADLNKHYDKEVCGYSIVEYGRYNAKFAGKGQAAFDARRNKVGDVLDWQEDENGKIRKIRVIEKENHYIPYEEARNSLVQRYLNKEYDRLYQRTLREIDVKRTAAYEQVMP